MVEALLVVLVAAIGDERLTTTADLAGLADIAAFEQFPGGDTRSLHFV